MKENREYTEQIILTTCKTQTHTAALHAMMARQREDVHHGTPAGNAEMNTEQGFDEGFRQCELYGS